MHYTKYLLDKITTNFYLLARLALLAMLTIPLGACCSYCSRMSLPGLPTCKPIVIAEANQQVSFDIEIVRRRDYNFELNFYYFNDSSQVDANSVLSLLNDPPAGKREPFYVRIDVVRTDLAEPQTVFSAEREPKSEPKTEDGSIKQDIADVVLAPGKYQVTVNSLRGAPALAGRTVDFCMDYRLYK